MEHFLICIIHSYTKGYQQRKNYTNYLGKPNALSITMKSDILTLFLSSFVYKYKKLTFTYSGENEYIVIPKLLIKVFYI